MTDQLHAQPRALHDAANVAHLTTTELTHRLNHLARAVAWRRNEDYRLGVRVTVAVLFGSETRDTFDGMLEEAEINR